MGGKNDSINDSINDSKNDSKNDSINDSHTKRKTKDVRLKISPDGDINPLRRQIERVHFLKPIAEFLRPYINEIPNYLLASDLILSELSAEILKKRVSLGLTQKDLADRFNISQSMVSKWESGDYNFTVEQLCKIAEMLKLDVDVAFWDTPSA